MKNKLLLFMAFAISITLNSCKDDDDDLPACTDDIEWEYDGEHGPDHWDDLCLGYAACGGSSQSPINLTGATDDATLAAIPQNYSASGTHIVNKGHTLQFNYDAGSTITVNGSSFELLQFHTHTHSEHSKSGTFWPMEIHFVHKNAATGNLAVIGVFVEEGAENALLNQFVSHLPATKDATYDDAATTYSALDFMPTNKSYFTYSGSLTTPPCSEIVTWFVMENPIQASAEQIHDFEMLEHENARPIQSLAGRTIRHYGM